MSFPVAELQAFAAAFLASSVELVEALTIVLAVGVSRGWKAAMTGAFAALAVLVVSVALFGPWLTHINTPVFKLVVGTLLLMFGARWLRKAILRSSGVIPLHDEAKAFEEETAALSKAPKDQSGWDHVGIFTSFNGVFVEGLEVVLIVLGVGSSGKKMIPAASGAAVAAVIVIGLGLALRHPLTKIPENLLKLAVGVLISAFGTFWVGEGLQVTWPVGDLSLVALSTFYLVCALVCIAICRRMVGRSAQSHK